MQFHLVALDFPFTFPSSIPCSLVVALHTLDFGMPASTHFVLHICGTEDLDCAWHVGGAGIQLATSHL